MSKQRLINLNVGMPEFMLVSGVYIHSDAKYIAIVLIVTGVLSAFVRYCMDRNDEDQKRKSDNKLIKEMTDSVTALQLASTVPKSTSSGGFH